MLVVLPDFFGSVIKITGRFPRLLVRGITNPVNKVFEFVVTDSQVQNLFDFVFQGIFDTNGRRWRLDTPQNSVRVMGIEKAGVKDWVNFHTRGKVEFERHFTFADDFEDLVGTEGLEIELGRRTSCRNISPR
jgi:hypothetical protein